MKIRELLDDPQKWCQGALARSNSLPYNPPCDPRSEVATSWCLMGAICKCYTPPASTGERISEAEADQAKDESERAFVLQQEITKKVQKALGAMSIGRWNDEVEFEQVRALVERLDI